MASKKNKKQKLRARLPRGFGDRNAADIRATNQMIAAIGEVYEKYGFDPVETPMFEFTDCLGKFLPDSDRPNEGVFSIQDDDEQWMSLRYDLTAPLARHVAENFNTIQMPYRTYRSGWVFRNEKPGPGRFRQFMQMDADSIGAPGVQADAEMCMMMADVMDALGLKGKYIVRVNNRKVLDGVMEAIGLGGDENEARRLDVMRAIDKLDRLGVEGVRALLGDGRKDESGDFTKGVGLASIQMDTITKLIGEPGKKYDSTRFLSHLDYIFEQSDIAKSGAADIGEIINLVRTCGYGDNQIIADPTCVRGLEYYTGPVYEVELTFPVTNEKGEEVVFGSVGGGGRYDGLIKRFTGQPVPSTGFSIGVSRLMTALKNLGKLDTSDALAPVLVTVMDGREMGAYQKMVQDLRNAGIRAEMYQGNWKKFGNQLKYADRRGCPIAIIQGGDERAEGVVQIKDMIEGRKQAEAIESNAEWRETRPGQYSVKTDDLVAEVDKRLKEQADDRVRAGE